MTCQSFLHPGPLAPHQNQPPAASCRRAPKDGNPGRLDLLQKPGGVVDVGDHGLVFGRIGIIDLRHVEARVLGRVALLAVEFLRLARRIPPVPAQDRDAAFLVVRDGVVRRRLVVVPGVAAIGLHEVDAHQGRLVPRVGLQPVGFVHAAESHRARDDLLPVVVQEEPMEAVRLRGGIGGHQGLVELRDVVGADGFRPRQGHDGEGQERIREAGSARRFHGGLLERNRWRVVHASEDTDRCASRLRM